MHNLSQQIISEVWRRNRQEKIIFNKSQDRMLEAYNKKADPTFVIECSRQIGKTYFACALADKVARESKCQIRLATAFQVDIEPIIVANFQNVLSTCPAALQPTFKVAKLSYVYPNGSVISLVGLDKNPDKLRGNRIKLVIIEEAGFVDSDTLKYVLDSVIAGAQLREPDARTVLISTPPEEGSDHTFCEIADACELLGSYIKITIDESDLPKEAIEAFAKKLGGRETIAFRREALCERIVESNRSIIPEWSDALIQAGPKPQAYELMHKYVGMDLGRTDNTALIFGYYNFPKASLIIEDELTLSGPEWTTITLKDEVLATEKSLWGETKPFRRISDNNNPHLCQDLSSLHNLHFQETTKESLEAMINEVRLLVGQGRIIINPKCKMLIGCLRHGVWDKKRKAFARSKAYGHFDHLAALIYLVRNLAQHTNPVPTTYGRDMSKTWVKPSTNYSETALALKKALLPNKRKT